MWRKYSIQNVAGGQASSSWDNMIRAFFPTYFDIKLSIA